MTETLTVHEPLLVNTIGHTAGSLIFGIFVYLLLRDRAGARLRGSRLTLAAASLAFLWNFASLLVLASTETDSLPSQLAVAVSSSALSLLPSVLLHLSLGGLFRPITLAGYALGAAAVAIHSSERILGAPDYHRLALMFTTAGFGALTLISAVEALRTRQQDRRRLMSRIVGSMSLFLFAMSFVHFGAVEAHRAWPIELVVHHAGIPLALFVLLQDYRFVLLDAFIRFLANILLAASFVFLAARAADHLDAASRRPFQQGLLLVGACLLLVLFAMVRSGLQAWLTQILFRRPDLDRSLRELRARCAAAKDEADCLHRAGLAMAEFVNAEVIFLEDERLLQLLKRRDLVYPSPVTDLPELREELESRGVEVVVRLRPLQAETRHLFLGRRRGGRRYLSEDLQALARMAAQVADHIEHFRESEMRRLVAQAELRALQSQIHPHFLFNVLNTLYGVIPREAGGARRLVLNLSDMLRYFFQSEKTYIPLEQELNIVKAYLEIESLRLGPKLRTELDVDPLALRVPIPILSVEPLVENAVKHGVANRPGGGVVRLEARLGADGLRIRVTDSGNGFPAQAEGHGVGLENVRRRLQLCYGPEAHLEIESGPEGAAVGFLAPAGEPEAAYR